MTERRTKTIKTDYLARVEGEGAMLVQDRDGQVDGRQAAASTSRRASSRRSCAAARFTEAPDITARICGICPVAYQMSAVHAMEDACGVEVGGQLRALRRLLYCGEWIESHALHVFMLHAPDFLGYESAIEMAQRPPASSSSAALRAEEGRQRADDASSAGARSTRSTCGSAASTARRASASCAPLVEKLERAREIALETVRLTRRLRLPRLRAGLRARRARREPGEYPIDRGRIVSNRGLDIAVAEYDEHFVEEHVAVLERAALAAARARRLPRRAARALRARTSTGSRRSRARRPREAGLGAG